ncbi:MAG: hypothetical protein R2794_06595 [Chitinophagales bacterium]
MKLWLKTIAIPVLLFLVYSCHKEQQESLLDHISIHSHREQKYSGLNDTSEAFWDSLNNTRHWIKA